MDSTGPADDEAMRRTLQRELRAVERRIQELTEGFDEIVAGSELVNTDDEHDPEGATIAFERAQVAALRDHALHRRDEIQQALQSLATGDYGRCDDCGEAISAERLEALPGTTRCRDCA
ncbi:MAG: TraR/DksA family transcriptional regulator [Microthrixaceae bacterium]